MENSVKCTEKAKSKKELARHKYSYAVATYHRSLNEIAKYRRIAAYPGNPINTRKTIPVSSARYSLKIRKGLLLLFREEMSKVEIEQMELEIVALQNVIDWKGIVGRKVEK